MEKINKKYAFFYFVSTFMFIIRLDFPRLSFFLFFLCDAKDAHSLCGFLKNEKKYIFATVGIN